VSTRTFPDDGIVTLWIRTFGRNPRIPEIEETKLLIEKFGEKRVEEIFRDAVLKGFKNLGTLIKAIDDTGIILPKDQQKQARVIL
ncbi:MAG: hypothetical protein D6732_22630, partial [Methanobacteriota archaeon]